MILLRFFCGLALTSVFCLAMLQGDNSPPENLEPKSRPLRNTARTTWPGSRGPAPASQQVLAGTSLQSRPLLLI